MGSMAKYMKEGDTLPTFHRTVTQERIAKYAAASGDFNPIHVDTSFGAKSQFGSTIAHGMMIAAEISESLTRAFEVHWFEGGRLKLRFRAPVFPGDTVSAFGEVKKVLEHNGGREIVCSVGVCRQNGEVVITGEAVVKLPFAE